MHYCFTSGKQYDREVTVKVLDSLLSRTCSGKKPLGGNRPAPAPGLEPRSHWHGEDQGHHRAADRQGTNLAMADGVAGTLRRSAPVLGGIISSNGRPCGVAPGIASVPTQNGR